MLSVLPEVRQWTFKLSESLSKLQFLVLLPPRENTIKITLEGLRLQESPLFKQSPDQTDTKHLSHCNNLVHLLLFPNPLTNV